MEKFFKILSTYNKFVERPFTDKKADDITDEDIKERLSILCKRLNIDDAEIQALLGLYKIQRLKVAAPIDAYIEVLKRYTDTLKESL